MLGYDTSLSKDHDWGPRLTLFVSDEDFLKFADQTRQVLSDKLPYTIRGISTNFGKPNPHATQLLEKIENGPVSQHVHIDTVDKYLGDKFDPNKLSTIDWLTIPELKLLESTSGKVYYDGLGELAR